MKTLKNCRFGPNSIVIILLVGALGFWSYTQAIDGTIPTCIRTDGSMYVIGDLFRFKKCKSTEQSYSWNTQGPKGEKGDRGDKGDRGIQGEKGEPGPAGKDSEIKHLHVVDGAGQDLGLLVGVYYDEYPIKSYYTKISNLGPIFRFDSDGKNDKAELFDTGLFGGVFFSEDGCTGVAYSRISGWPDPEKSGKIFLDNMPRYFKGTTDKGSKRMVRSYSNGTSCAALDAEEINLKRLEEFTVTFTEPIIWPITVVER